MGLRTASVRRPYVEVMAPALTETTQNQTFKLSPKDNLQPASPINTFETDSKYLPDVPGGTYCNHQEDKLGNAVNNLNTLALVSETLLTARCSDFNNQQQSSGFIMSDQTQTGEEKMGLQETTLDSVSKTHHTSKPPNNNEVDQIILNNLTESNLQNAPPDVTEVPPNVDEIMQVIKSFSNPSNANETPDLNFEENVADLSNNLTIEKFLTEVDMMNMSMEEQQDPEIDSTSMKETQSKELIAELKKKQAKVERRLDFLVRKIHKIQARNMGQHVSGEIAGVFEHVHRSLKRLKDTAMQQPEGPEDSKNAINVKPMSYGSTKAMLKKLEMAAALQANSVARQKHLPKYFGSGSSETGNHRINVPGVVSVPAWSPEHKLELQKVAGFLHTELSVVQHEVDSEATESSSGGESCDEMQPYNNPHQQYLSIQKRALWRYATSRAAIAARWTWLQAQISDLEYRIRQHTDLHRQIRVAKGEITLGGQSPPRLSANYSPTAVNGYRGQLPGNSPITKELEQQEATACASPDYQCARTRPLMHFKKRKLLQISGLHVISKKAARPSSVRCGCVPTMSAPCAVCTGRTDPKYPRDPADTLSKAERISLVDPGFHPVFSLSEDVSYGLHCDAIMKNPEWQQRSTRMKSLKILKSDRSDKALLEHRAKKLEQRTKKYNRLLKPSTASALSAKIKNKIRNRKVVRHCKRRNSAKVSMGSLHGMPSDGADEEVEAIGRNNSNLGVSRSNTVSPSSSPLLHMQAISGYNKRNRTNSYDIDNIVIPYSVAASTRVEKLQYKEILTPKWRIADPEYKCDTKNNGAVKNPPSQDSDVEDLSEDSVLTRHEKSEYDEKKKFLSYLKLPIGHVRPRSHKRTDSLAESSGANTPDPLSPHQVDHHENATNSPMTSPPATPLPIQNNSDDLPSISAMRRRTISQSKFVNREREVGREENNSPEHVDIPPFDTRTFPLDEDTYEKMLKTMPENYQFKTNVRAQDSGDFAGLSYLDEKVDSPGTESTESAIGEEDPNDPEWMDIERPRDRHKR